MLREHYPVEENRLSRLSRQVRQTEKQARHTRERLDRVIEELRKHADGKADDSEDGWQDRNKSV